MKRRLLFDKWRGGFTIDQENKKAGVSSIRYNLAVIECSEKEWFYDLLDTGTFTIECWCKSNLPSNTDYSYNLIIGDDKSGDTNAVTFFIAVRDKGTKYQMHFGNFSSYNLSNPIDIKSHYKNNDWNHLCVCSKDSSITYYVNGKSCGTRSLSKIKPASYTLCIGGRREYGSNVANSDCPLNLDSFRISKICRYDTDFTPSELPFEVD